MQERFRGAALREKEREAGRAPPAKNAIPQKPDFVYDLPTSL